MGGEITSIVTDVLVALSSTGIVFLVNNTRKKINHVDTKVKDLELAIAEHTIVVQDIALSNNISKKIDKKIRQSYEYIDDDDSKAKTFLYLQGEIAKSCIEWAITTHLEVSNKEVETKFESSIMNAKEYLLKFDPEFDLRVRTKMQCLYKAHIKKVIKIVEDNLVNSKVDRFFTLTDHTIDEVITTFVRERLIYKNSINAKQDK